MTQENYPVIREQRSLTSQPIALTPKEVVDNASAQAKLLMDIVEKTGCFQIISDKKYLQVEAWETIGAFNQVHAQTDKIDPIVREGDTIGYQANVLLWKNGEVVGGASMPCFFTENCCRGKEGDAKHKACMSAAQTFATSKAYRMNYSYIAILAGYQPTPAEEMAGTESVNKVEHWCELHQTNFFKKGKMKSYAHPIGDSGEWCHEHTNKTATPKKEPDHKQAEKDKADYWPKPPPEDTQSDSSTTEEQPKPIPQTKGEAIPHNIQSLLNWAYKKDNNLVPSQVCIDLGVKDTKEITDFEGAYYELKAIYRWE